jgi:hypothetical protein
MTRLRGLRGNGYEIFSSGHLPDAGTPLEFTDEHFAYLFLARLAQDPLNILELRLVAADLGLGLSSYNTTETDLLRCLAANLVDRRIRVFGFEEERLVVDSTKPGETETTPPPIRPPKAAEEKTWIKFQVLHDETGRPVAGVQVTVKFPDGSTKESRTDETGMIELTDIPAGSYGIEAMMHSDAFEVVSLA